jgi:hypothetical protein
MLIHSLYGLSAPSAKLVELREKKIAKVKKEMGNKYLLAININKKETK